MHVPGNTKYLGSIVSWRMQVWFCSYRTAWGWKTWKDTRSDFLQDWGAGRWMQCFVTSTGIDELECTLWLMDIRTSNISNYNIGHRYESALLTQRVMVTHSDWVSVKSQGLGEVSPSASGTTSWTQGSFQSTSRSRQGLASDGQFRHLDGLSEDPLSYSMEMSSGSQEKTVKRNWIVSLVQVLESFAYHQPSSISVCSPQVLLRVQGAAFLPFWGIFGVMTLSCYSKSLQVRHYKLTSYDT